MTTVTMDRRGGRDAEARLSQPSMPGPIVVPEPVPFPNPPAAPPVIPQPTPDPVPPIEVPADPIGPPDPTPPVEPPQIEAPVLWGEAVVQR